MRTTLLFLGLFGVTACPADPLPPRPPVQLALQFVMRSSCGAVNTLDYDTSCLAAVYFVVRDSAGNIVNGNGKGECQPLADRRQTMRSILNGEALINYAGLSTNASYSFEVRGLHANFLDAEQEIALCSAPDDSDYWLFWGNSGLVDLTIYDNGDAGSPFIPIFVDCRDCATDDEDICPTGSCFGCLAMTEGEVGVCPSVFPRSVCAPASTALCGRNCQDNDDCFEGAQTCSDDNRCVTDNTEGKLCSACTTADQCTGDLHCVGRPGETEGFCAPLCPNQICVTGTKCTRLGNGIVDIGVE